MQKSKLINLGCGKTFHPAWDNFDLSPAESSVRHLNLLRTFPFQDGSYEDCYSSHVLEHMPRSYAPKFVKEVYRILRPGGIFRLVVPDLEQIVRRYLQELEAATSGEDEAVARHQWMSMELLDQLTRSFSGGFMGRLWNCRPLQARGLIVERLGEEAKKWISKIDEAFSKGEKALEPTDLYNILEPTPEEELKFRNQGEIHRWMYDRISLKKLVQEAGFQDVKVCSALESSILGFSGFCLDTNEEGETRKPDSLFMEGIR
jgi:predicted SAM-dependent methyltransferase